MKLQHGERSILAHFADAQAAHAALEELEQAGFDAIQLARVAETAASPEGGSQPTAIRGEESSLASAILEAGGLDRTSGILLAASPEVSGMSAPETDSLGPFLLTVVTQAERQSEAVAVIRRHGGTV